VDANFGLVHKRNGGQSAAPAKISTFFIQQDLVDKYVEGLQDEGESEKVIIFLLVLNIIMRFAILPTDQ
jgi:hypothetical protein